MAAPTSASGWTNSNNAILADAVYASSTAQRVEGLNENSLSLVATGFGFTGGVGDTVNGITVQINARKSGALDGTLVVYLLNSGTPVGSSKTIALAAGAATFVLGGATDNWGAGFTGANIGNLQVGAYVAPGGTANGSVTGEVDWIDANVTSMDTTPDAFLFTDQNPVATATMVTSNTVTITGISAPTTITVSGDASSQWEKNASGDWSNLSGTVSNNDVVRVRHVSASNNGGVVNTTATIGGVSDTFTSTAQVSDTTPDAFSFAGQTGAEPGVQYISNTVTITGINAAAAASVSGGGWYKNGVYQGTTAGTVVNGDQVAVNGTASATFGASVTTTLTIGGVAGGFTITTRAADTTPNPFAFTDQSGVAVSTVITSDVVTVAGIEQAAAVSVSGGEYEINGSGTWVTLPGTINNGQTIRVRHTSSAILNASVNTTLTIGGVSDTFTSTTVGADSTPDAFSFAAATQQHPGRLIESANATITGINVSVGVTCSAGADVSINGGAYSTTGTITNGQTVKVRVRSSVVSGQTVTATVTIGGVTGSFTVTTVRSQQPDF